MSAQDIIITRSNEKIEAKIDMITDTEIHYKKASNTEGPLYVTRIENVNSIMFANGEVQTFDRKENLIKKAQTLYKSNGVYMYGDSLMNHVEYTKFLQDNCVEAYNFYKNGHNLVLAGKLLLSGGLLCEAIGWCIYIFKGAYVPPIYVDYSTEMNRIMRDRMNAAYAMLTIGAACEIACIPVWVTGHKRCSRAMDTFNVSCANNKPSTSWNLKVHPTGVGLALNF